MDFKKLIPHKIRDLINLFIEWVLSSPKKCTKSFFLMILTLLPVIRGIYYYRIGRLSYSLKLLESYKNKNLFISTLYLRIDEFLKVNKQGFFELPKKRVNNKDYIETDHTLIALHNSYPFDSAGYAVRSHLLLKKMKKQKINFSVYTRPNYPGDLPQHQGKKASVKDIVDGIEYNRLQNDNVSLGQVESDYISAYAKLLMEKACEKRAYCIHASSNYIDGLAGVYAARKLGIKSIYEVRGLWHLTRASKEKGYKNSEHYKYCHICEITAAKNADKVITLSTPLKNFLIREGVAADKIDIHPNFSDESKFYPIPKNQFITEKYGLKDNYVVGYIGSLVDYEGIDLIITAVSILHRKNIPVKLLIVGKGRNEKIYHKLAKKVAPPGVVIFTGFIPHIDIIDYYSVIDLMPFPRRNHEVCALVPPLKIFEALAMEKKIIVSDLPPLTEIVLDKKNVKICKTESAESLADAMENLIMI